MNIVRQIAHFFGYDFRKYYKISTPTISAGVINVIRYHGIDLVLDVVANVGQYASDIRKEGYEGDIHSFEPVQSAYKQLQSACCADSRWFAHQLALGAAAGEQKMHVMAASDLSSFYAPNTFGETRYKKMRVSHTEKVAMETVDIFLHRQELKKRKILLKMDTQGYDLEVLAGAQSSLNSIVALQSELSLKPLYFNMPHYLKALKIYESYGYSIANLNPISKDKNLSIIEIDCLLTKDDGENL